MLKSIKHTIIHRWMKLRWQPIKVYCFHHVSEQYEPLTMWDLDWIEMGKFKAEVLNMKASGTEFISLLEAHEKLKRDRFRCEKYAVLTADDGYKSVMNILPWLEEQNIPITLFVNTKYQDGRSWSKINEEQARRIKPDVEMLTEVCPDLYLSKAELIKVAAMPNVTIGMHGHEHLDATKQTVEEFKMNVEKCQSALKDVPHAIPYFAYTWGKHSAETDEVLKVMGLVPVLISGTVNYNNAKSIDRQLLQ